MSEFDARAMMRAEATTDGNAARKLAPPPPRPLSPAAVAVAAQPIPPAYSPIVLAGSVRLIEFGLIAFVGAALYALYVVPIDGFQWHYLALIPTVALIGMLALQAADVYQVQAFRGYERQYFRLASAWTIVFLLTMAITFFARLQTDLSRVWLSGFYIVGLMVLIGFRIALFYAVRHWTREGRLDRRAVLVGADESGEKLVHALEAQKDSDVRVIGVFDDRGDERTPTICAGHLKLGTVDDLVEFARRTRVDLVLFTLPISAEARILQMLKKLWVLPVDIRLSAHSSKLRFRPRAYSYIGSVPLLDVFDRPITDWDVVMKWLFDKAVGGLMLIALSPILLVTALAIKLDSRGPVLFKQKRYGFNNEAIEVYKFRSLYADMTDHAAAKSVTKDDPRVTRVGRFIRKTSIDELPQLFNVVLKGNLSLIGPRPHAIGQRLEARQFDDAVDGYFARHRVKPGITGWAQINGYRGEIDSQDKIQGRVEYDLYYIENWSVLFDLYILLRTPFALLKAENAY